MTFISASPFVFGASTEVERIEKYHLQSNERPDTLPLYASRGQFRATAG
jgi:fructose-1,6-bisphosphatase I/sedoheptulose-1,7-bisphosphatase